jgi:hypothetical protein
LRVSLRQAAMAASSAGAGEAASHKAAATPRLNLRPIRARLTESKSDRPST